MDVLVPFGKLSRPEPWEEQMPPKVEIRNMKFNPASLTVAKGDKVQWTNTMGIQHTVTADDGSFDSGPIGQNQTFSQTFNATGTVPYHCEIHPNMTATIVVS
jgi:plastocyanin